MDLHLLTEMCGLNWTTPEYARKNQHEWRKSEKTTKGSQVQVGEMTYDLGIYYTWEESTLFGFGNLLMVTKS